MDGCLSLDLWSRRGHVQTWLTVATPITRRTEKEGQYSEKEDRGKASKTIK